MVSGTRGPPPSFFVSKSDEFSYRDQRTSIPGPFSAHYVNRTTFTPVAVEKHRKSKSNMRIRDSSDQVKNYVDVKEIESISGKKTRINSSVKKDVETDNRRKKKSANDDLMVGVRMY